MLGKRGHGRGELNRPTGVAIGASDMVYVGVGEGGSGNSVFTPEGRFVTSFGERLGPPCGVAVDDNGVVYVCYYNSFIRLF